MVNLTLEEQDVVFEAITTFIELGTPETIGKDKLKLLDSVWAKIYNAQMGWD